MGRTPGLGTDFGKRAIVLIAAGCAILPQASQIEINPKADITFARTLRSILRQDPDVICVGEIRDEETAEIALRASQTGHLVLATVHSDSNATALLRLLDLRISPLLLSSGLSLVMSQRLLRCLCERCRQPAELSDSQIVQLDKKGIDRSGIFEASQCKHYRMRKPSRASGGSEVSTAASTRAPGGP